jgi:hypothetical protein
MGTEKPSPNERRACLCRRLPAPWVANGRQVAEDRPTCAVLVAEGRPVCQSTGRRDCYWLYVVTSCKSKAILQEPIKNPARFPWHEVKKVDHYYLTVDALTQPMRVKEAPAPYGE